MTLSIAAFIPEIMKPIKNSDMNSTLLSLRTLCSVTEEGMAREFFAPPDGFTASESFHVPRGGLIEFVGRDKTSFILSFLKQHESLKILWVEEKQKILPTAIRQSGVDLDRITFAIVEKDHLQNLRKALNSQAFDVVVTTNTFDQVRQFQTLHLLCEKSNSMLFLLSKEVTPAWPISLQLKLSRQKENRLVEVLRQRYRKSEINSESEKLTNVHFINFREGGK